MKQTKGISSQATKPYRRHDAQLRRHTSDTERARAVTGGPHAEGVGHRPPFYTVPLSLGVYSWKRRSQILRSLGTTPISGKTLSERKGHSRSSRRVPGYSRSSSRNSKFHSRNTKFHSRNGSPRLEQYENQNSRSNSRSDSRNWWEPT